MRKQYVYVGQFDTIYKIPLDEWRSICEAGSRGEPYQLKPSYALKRRPRFILCDPEVKGAYWCARHDIRYFEPLDWYPEDFSEALFDL